MLSRKTFLALVPVFCLASSALAFSMKAQIDRTRAELGETLIYRLQLSWDGRLAFQPQVSAPTFEGFEARGPQQSSSFQWTNGQVAQVIELAWELVPIKSGNLVIAAAHMSSKDPARGELKAQSQELKVQIIRPKNIFGATPKAQSDIAPPAPGADELRDIKGDLGLPWARLSGIALGFSAVFAALILLARSRKTEPVAAPKGTLERALGSLAVAETLLKEGKALPALSLAGSAWKEHARDRLAIGQDGLTLLAAARLAAKRMTADHESVGAETAHHGASVIAVSVFGGHAPDVETAQQALVQARQSILLLEKLTQTPAPKITQDRKGKSWPKKKKS